MKSYAVILAGGSGTRFWPRSRQSKPKQLCKITDTKETMLEQTLHRLDKFVPIERRLIVTHVTQTDMTKKLTQNLCPNVLSEPYAMNTAAALALASLQLLLIGADEQDIMFSLPADHKVKDHSSFQKTLLKASALAQEGYLCLVGIPPTKPETGFGYIQRGEVLTAQAYRVKRFKEKPDLSTAQTFLESGDYFWNSGIFVWTLKTICEEFAHHLPQIWKPLYQKYRDLKEHKKTFEDMDPEDLGLIYKSLPELAIDHGILEKTSNCTVIAAEFDWNDVGTWTALTEVYPEDEQGNLKQGNIMGLKTTNSILISEGPFLATYGVDNLIVVVEKDCVLVCPKDKAQGIKDIVAKLKEKGLQDLY